MTSPGRHQACPDPTPPDSRIRVLVADDQPVVLRGFAAVLKAQSDLVVVATACDGSQAVRLARQTNTDVALLDIRMPVLNGIARGDALLAPKVTRRLVAEFARQRRPAPAGSPLTPRETEVLRLVARGLSNAEIATDLVVTEHTVKTHVARLPAKLGLRDRTQAVIHAYESGLVAPRT